METNTTPDTTKARLEHWKAAPEVMKAMLALEQTVRGAGINPVQLEFIKLRASQINGCAFCMNLHFNDAVKAGVSAQRLHLLPVWREAAHLYSPAERAVLAWTEQLTRLPGGHVSDGDFAGIKEHFDDEQVTRITLAIAAINAWNRFGVGFRLPVEAVV
ncbi:carboxymuconolactone decarboxylase family protein [Luteolibacter flavescens]|uniref:Carboxymuconolactone decarboxylase family protein n=1 Tax=Luteolibacter flavescens TaxID=1859460 RepID=A0ABT3FKQ5_9BACT|nr:carboxymuconolactone decarboxylase family protein [Luteolibacter flavescens]MCW1884168.1 carboxymuconolactone decarboxylase family protein [Luteolibacter flavescens]